MNDQTQDRIYFKMARLLSVTWITVYGLIRLFEISARHMDYRVALIINIFSLSTSAALLVFMFFVKDNEKQSFGVPFLIFILFTLCSIYLRDFEYYFFIWAGICGIGSMYHNYKKLLTLIIISNIIIFLLILCGIISATDTISLPQIIVRWLFSVFVSIFFLVLALFASEKNSRSIKAMDTFSTLMETTPNLMAVVDELDCINYISRPMMEFAHIQNIEEAAGKPLLDLFSDTNVKMMINEILKTKDFYEDTKEICFGETSRYFRIVAGRLKGNTKGLFIDITDITPIIEAQLNAETASLAKSEFLATMSHEIRTPLNVIIGLSEIQLHKELPEDTHNDLNKIYNSGSNLLAIINDILDISKIETGNLDLIPVEYDVPSLVNDTVQLNIVRIGSKPITFTLDIDETIPSRLRGDELRVKQILNNLLSNAFKYTQEGSVKLQILWKKSEEDAFLTFIVKDSGIGIKQEDMRRLFSDYSQLDARANRKIEGTGLGLSITKKLVEMMDGTISVESEYGKGSVFTVSLRQEIAAQQRLGKETAEGLKSFRFNTNRYIRGKNLIRSYMPYGKILVVDDVATNLDVAKGLMMSYGLSIDCASSGQEAIEKIRAEKVKYDAIFMDHMMPEIDGIEAARIIRNEIGTEYAKTVPIIALTANAIAGNEEIFLSHGFNAFLPKPIDIMRLDILLNQWVRDKQNEETLQQAERERPDRTTVKDAGIKASRVLDGFRIEGVNLESGLERYETEETYLQILRSYLIHTPELLEKLGALPKNKLSEYAVMMHGLKGISYGICADDIGKQAEELERASKAGDIEKVNAQKDNFITAVEKVLVGIRELLQNTEEHKPGKSKVPVPDQSLLEKLLEASREYKAVEMEKIVAELERHNYESGGELISWLRKQLDNVEYDAIGERLEAISKVS